MKPQGESREVAPMQAISKIYFVIFKIQVIGVSIYCKGELHKIFIQRVDK